MVEIIGVRFKNAGKTYSFDPTGIETKIGDRVIVETARGMEVGKVVVANHEADEGEIVAELKPIIRMATEEDLKQLAENEQKEKEAYEIAVKKILEHKLEMKLVGVEYTFDRSKIIFQFTADGRVDFRELVKSLAGIFKTRIELRQIGVRDEARQLGSIGICGRCLCCSTFLEDFSPVSIKMAKEQGLSLNPTKISGVCGRLMCCLQYEQNAYEDMLKKMPDKGSLVETPDGTGVVVDSATLKGQVKVKFTEGDTVSFQTYGLEDFKCVGKCKCPHKAGNREESQEIFQGEPAEKTAEVNGVPEEVTEDDPKGERKRRPRRRRGRKPDSGENQKKNSQNEKND